MWPLKLNLMKNRLDQALVVRGLVSTRSQAENLIRLGKVEVDGVVVVKTGYFISGNNKIRLRTTENYVSRAGIKLAEANKQFKADFKDKVVLDVGSSTGGFTDYALQKGAKKVIAVEVGTNQMHPKLVEDPRVDLHEKTDIRNFKPQVKPDIILVDVAFISLREILPYLNQISGSKTEFLVLLKPQFEAGKGQINRGVIKNDKIRRQVIRNFENWVKKLFIIKAKVDSSVIGAKGNQERFYLLKPL